jgi:hypothetical protein
MHISSSPGVSSFLDEQEFTGSTTDSWVAAATFNNASRFFSIMENTHASNDMEWRIVVRATDGGNEEIIYGPVGIVNGSKDATSLDGGAYYEVRVEVRSDVAGNAATYKLQSAVVRQG